MIIYAIIRRLDVAKHIENCPVIGSIVFIFLHQDDFNGCNNRLDIRTCNRMDFLSYIMYNSCFETYVNQSLVRDIFLGRRSFIIIEFFLRFLNHVAKKFHPITSV